MSLHEGYGDDSQQRVDANGDRVKTVLVVVDHSKTIATLCPECDRHPYVHSTWCRDRPNYPATYQEKQVLVVQLGKNEN